ncbi:actin-like ATPase domain-containing protein [Aulographum hederae CBS 113979]|uniref:Actin-like ATPase domain-containing protein n=1 Tax=Aulographum hederae CBS 113979 TaxID=1176131 RepID=A0A6G1GQH3_9PEZI|nr:actin-like ATPase domain-containing protein [Aulographum hederae CBS 113979]
MTSFKNHKIIIGVDYGTTFTGVSYVPSTKSSIKDINIIRSWPGPSKEADEAWKTPSRIAYASENMGAYGNHWGYQVTPKMKSYSWTKLLLDDADNRIRQDDSSVADLLKSQGDGLMKLPPYRSATAVCADYLCEIYKFTIAELNKRLSPEVVSITPFEFWFTVPAIWSDKAKNATKQAATLAGFASRPGDTIFLIPEPEAAAIASLKSLTHDGVDSQVKPGDGILVCDCGGGTVDITAYSIKTTSPILKFEELIVGTGGKCGSTFIDRQLHAWMSTKFGSTFDKIAFEKKGPGSRFMKEFESQKREFGKSRELNQVFELPLVMPLKDSLHYDSDECVVKITALEMALFFDPVVKEITRLIARQVEIAGTAARGRHNINTIILVGGFGDSAYLNDSVRLWCRAHAGIRLICPESPQAAIVRGAALRGLEGTKPLSRRCRRHYGFEMGDIFREGIDPQCDGFWDEYDNVKRCRNRVQWEISKGQAIDETTFISSKFFIKYSLGRHSTHEFELFCCSMEAPPEYTTDPRVEYVGTVFMQLNNVDHYTLESKIVQGERKYLLNFESQIFLGKDEGVFSYSSPPDAYPSNNWQEDEKADEKTDEKADEKADEEVNEEVDEEIFEECPRR